MGQYTPQGFGDRLRGELERNQWDVRKLQAEVERITGKARGTSYASIWSYVHGQAPESEPRREVVDALAKLLRVLPEYLLFGGPKTEADSPLRVPDPAKIQAMQALRHAIYDAVMKEIGPLMPVGVDVPIVEMVMAIVASEARSSQLAGDSHGEDDDARYKEAAASLGRAIIAPLHALAIDPEPWPQQVKAQYVLQAMAGLMVPLDLKYFRAVVQWSDAREAKQKRKAKRSTAKRGGKK